MNALAKVASRVPANRVWILVFIFCFLGMLIDGVDLILLSYTLTSLKREFGLTNVEAGSLGSFTLAGMAVGGMVGGWAADQFGRVRVVTWSIILFSIGTAILGMTQNYWQFSVMRFISSMGLGALYIACSTLMAEYVPTRYRTTVLGALQAGWSVGYIVATLLAGWLLPDYGWRYLYYVAIVPVILAVMMRGIVPEPASWIEANADRARKKFKGIGRGSAPKPRNALKQIFDDPGSRIMFILWALTACFLQFGYYGVNNWMPAYLETEMGMDFKAMSGYLIGTYSAMIAGKILAGMAADWLGRRLVFAAGTIATAIFLPVIVLFHSPDNILWMLVGFGFVYGIPYSINAAYMTESFAAKIRGTAVGVAYNVGKVGAMAAPAAIGFIATHGSIGLGFLVMGVSYFICGVIPALFIKDKQFDPQTE